MAAEEIRLLELPAGVKGIVLFDSYYLCSKVVTACREKGFRFVGGVKKNRNFGPDGRARDLRKLKTYGANLLKREGRASRVFGKRYRLAQRVGRMSKVGRIKLVCSRRPRETSWIALVTDETRWSAKTVLSHYLHRWGIEVFFKMAKQHLGLGDYHMLRYRAIERYLCLVLIAHCLLIHFAVKDEGAQARAERSRLPLPSVPQL